MATILIPTPLRKYTNNQSKVSIPGADISGIISNLVSTHPEIRKHLLDGAGGVRSFVNVFVGQDDIKSLNNLQTDVSEFSIISIVPAIAGGNYKGE
ncbi:MoaD/ThiS family protein [Pedobacter sp. MC2016-05]|uniref:MoaD/ThiS family protein n=1 Tax=Pedobacter sp. MC2016-05 TaxID=2994474 RepID=UPI0022482FB0|nr:MoaD/ThiS family protein [Pedobacter sp. MC2016-05]MCX2473291.1 MoaD/ThiS family protein [Pedobacter sp. MC2016-05]